MTKNIAGFNLYSITYTLPHSDTQFGKLVVAKNAGKVEEKCSTPGELFEIKLIERDISMVIIEEE